MSLCWQCGGSSSPRHRVGEEVPLIHSEDVREIAEENNFPLLFVYAYLQHKLLIGRITLTSSQWESLFYCAQKLLLKKKHQISETSETTETVCTGLISVQQVPASEWTSIPLVIGEGFWGDSGVLEDNRIFFSTSSNGHGVLGKPFVSESNCVSFTPSQYLSNISHVICRLVTQRDSGTRSLSDLILWGLLHGDIEVFAHMLLTWCPKRQQRKKELAQRALLRSNWENLFSWLEILDHNDDSYAWGIISNFLIEIPGSLAGTRTDGMHLSVAQTALAIHGIEVPDDQLQDIFEIPNPDQWWQELLMQPTSIDTSHSLEMMYHFNTLRKVKETAKTQMPDIPTNNQVTLGHGQTTRHSALYAALKRIETRRNFKRVPKTHSLPPDWILSPNIPELEVRPGIYLTHILAIGDPELEVPSFRMVPVSKSFCACLGEHGDQGCIWPPYDSRYEIIRATALQERIRDSDEKLLHSQNFGLTLPS
jgi:hypothetical protein